MRRPSLESIAEHPYNGTRNPEPCAPRWANAGVPCVRSECYAVRNRSLPIDVSSDRLPVTTKENPSFHGYGLQNVQTTLAKYHSVYAMDYADGWFEFATDLPNTLIS